MQEKNVQQTNLGDPYTEAVETVGKGNTKAQDKKEGKL